MFNFIRKIKLKRRLKNLMARAAELEIIIDQDTQALNELDGRVIFTSCFYRNLENLEMELADTKDEMKAIEKELGKRKRNYGR